MVELMSGRKPAPWRAVAPLAGRLAVGLAEGLAGPCYNPKSLPGKHSGKVVAPFLPNARATRGEIFWRSRESRGPAPLATNSPRREHRSPYGGPSSASSHALA